MFLTNFLYNLLVAKKQSRLSQPEVIQLQKMKFHKLVQYVGLKSPYYKNIINKYHINIYNCKPQDFPILTKTDVINNFDSIITDSKINFKDITEFLKHSQNPLDLYLNKYYVIHTSGSTGVPGYYIFNQQEFIEGVVNIVFGNNFKLFQKMAFIGSTDGHFAGITMTTLAQKMPFLYREIKTFDTNLPLQNIIDGLNSMQPSIISGYVFMLRILAEAQKAGKLHIKPQIIQSGGEPLYKRDKDFIEKIFSTTITNVYASSENLIMGIGKDKFKGMYLMDNNLIFEITSDKTLVTNLFNYTLPLIRYQMTDRMKLIEDTTRLLPFTKVANVEGRHEHVPTFINNLGKIDFVNPLDLMDITSKHMDKLQIHIINKKNFIIKITLIPDTSKSAEKDTLKIIYDQMRALLDKKAMTNVRFKVEVVDHLWADPKTGKYQYVKIMQ